MKKIITIDGELAKQAAGVLNAIGLDVETVVRMTLKRVVRDGNISFLVAGALPPENSVIERAQEDDDTVHINKSIAVARFKEEGHFVSKNVTFASSNRATNNFWANPPFDVLDQDWYLILHDRQNKKLHLFRVPAGAVSALDLKSRNDREDRIDLQIYYNDPTYTDSRSKVSFAKYKVETIAY